MSLETTFKPMQPTVAVTTVAVQAVAPSVGNAGVASFRTYNAAATAQIIGYGTSAANAIAAIPGNAVTVGPGLSIYLDLPAATWFIGNTGSTFQVTPGQGGVGG
jgi:hypothetical protein